jgi:nucleotide-binding universal stress UspA family protein
LALGENRVEGQGALTAAAHPGDAHQPAEGDVDPGYVQVVEARPFDAEEPAARVRRNGTAAAAGVRFRVHFQKGDPVTELVNESRYADLMLMGYHAYNTLSMEGNQQLVKDMLSKSRCPIVLVPESGYNPDGVVLCYDGSDSSLSAINAFYHDFKPKCKDWPIYFVRVFEKEDRKEELDPALVEIMQLRFNKLQFVDLIGKPKDEIPYVAKQRGNHLVVMGAYGGSGIARFFSGSTADHILRSGDLLTYITH